MRPVELYRDLLKTARLFQDGNFRSYFLRIARDDWRKTAHTPEFLDAQKKNLDLLKRQTTIDNFYYRDQFAVRR